MPVQKKAPRRVIRAGRYCSLILYYVVALAGFSGAAARAQEAWPAWYGWAPIAAEAAGLDEARVAAAMRFGRERGGSGILIRGGHKGAGWGDPTRLYDLRSTTKSFGTILLGLAVQDGLVGYETPVIQYLPELGARPAANLITGWLPSITVGHLVTHTAGFAKSGGSEPLLFPPGTGWFYSDGGPNWLADLLTVRYGLDLGEVLRARVLAPMGIAAEQVAWRRNRYRDRQLRGLERRDFGSAIWTSVDTLSRLGLMLQRGGRWDAYQILDPGFVARATAHEPWLAAVACVDPAKCPEVPPTHSYGSLFWTNNDAHVPGLPPDAYWAAGQHTSFLLVIPSLDIVAARAGWPAARGWPPGERDLFYAMIAGAVR